MFKNLISKLNFNTASKKAQKLKLKKKKTNYSKAFIHRSYDSEEHNERLEFLGDSVLSLIITDILYEENKSEGEGFMSKKRSQIVSRKHLNMVGKKIIPEQKIKTTLKKIPANIFGNTLEAIVGAIYLDEGINGAKKFVKTHIYNSKYENNFIAKDPKSEILKYGQKKGLTVEFKINDKKGAEHKKVFYVDLYINYKLQAKGEGSSIKEAEQIASEKVINNLLLHI